MTTLVQRYAADLQGLPQEVQLALARLRELDDQTAQLTHQADVAYQQSLEEATTAMAVAAAPVPSKTAGTRPPSKRVTSRQRGGGSTAEAALPDGSAAAAQAQSSLAQAKALSEDKVALATQLYDSVDEHIRRLDAGRRVAESCVCVISRLTLWYGRLY
jgi:hypothetical protein